MPHSAAHWLRQPSARGPAILSEGNFCCVVAIIATEPKTVFPVIPSHETSCARCRRNCRYLEPFERENAGKCHRIGGLAFETSRRAPKRPPPDGGCLRTALDVSGYLDAIFWQDFSAFPPISLLQWTSLDVLERYWMVGRVGIEPTTN
jgi:hypothetical protein